MEIEKIVEIHLPPSFTSRPMSLKDAGQAVDLYNAEFSDLYGP